MIYITHTHNRLCTSSVTFLFRSFCLYFTVSHCYIFSADIKLRLHRELKIPPCRQILSGWARMKEYNNTPLSQLMLPRENALLLTVKTNEGGLSAEDE